MSRLAFITAIAFLICSQFSRAQIPGQAEECTLNEKGGDIAFIAVAGLSDSVVYYTLRGKPYGDEGYSIQATVIEDGKVDETRLVRVGTLAKPALDSISHALYDYHPQSGHTMCYEPSRGIAFYHEGKISSFLEICLKCSQVKVTGFLKRPEGELCPVMTNILKRTLGVEEPGE